MTDHSPAADDRRGWDRRVEGLEKNYYELRAMLQRLEIEVGHLQKDQGHIASMMNSHYTAMENGQKLLAEKMDGFGRLVNQLASDPGQTAAGRALSREIELLSTRATEAEKQADRAMRQISAYRNRFIGAAWLAGGGLGVSGVALLKAFGKF